METEMQQIP